MKLHVLAVGERLPRWAGEACADYQKRFPPHCRLAVRGVAAPRRVANADIARLREREYRALAAAVPAGALTVALVESGRPWSSERLARLMGDWLHTHKHVAFLIGGPDGLAPAALDTAGEQWSLSPLTLPHALARVIVVEQLYRAVSILADHPYHRS